MTEIFNQFLIWPILNALVAFYKLFLILRVPGALGLAIIALTILIRLIFYPLIGIQLRSAKKMQGLKPRLDELSKKFSSDKKRLQQEQLRLYKEAGVNPAAGCLPMLLQMPVFIALFQVFSNVLGNGNLEKTLQEINKIVYSPNLQITNIDLNFFGANLAIKPSSWQTAGWWLLLIPIGTAALQWYQTKLMTPSSAPVPQEDSLKKDKGGKSYPSQDKDNKQSSGKPADDMSKIMQTQMTYLFPVMIGWFAFSFPVGLALYWNTFTILGIVQQVQINKEKK